MYQLLAALPNNRLASATLTNSINIWDINTGASLAELQGHKRPVEALTVFQDSLLVSGASDGTIRFWDIESYLEVGRIWFARRCQLRGASCACHDLVDRRCSPV